MNLPNPNDEQLFYYWLAFVCFISSLAGIWQRQELKALQGFKRLLRLAALLITSMVAGYLVYELALYVTDHPRVSLACAGIGAYLGADTLDAIQKIILQWFERGRK